MENEKTGFIFDGDNSVSSAEKMRVISELQKLGKMLTFRITKDEEGWVAQCNEIEGIIAGGLNPDPSDSEIKSQIRESIYAAFGVGVGASADIAEENPAFTFEEVNDVVRTV